MHSEVLQAELKSHIQGEVQFDAITRKVYSVDASICEVEPCGVVCPRTIEEVQKAVEIAAAYDTCVVARGAATGIAGGCLGKGLIIDLSRHLTAIRSIDCERRFAICEAGVVQDRLNEALAPYGFRLGPDTSTGNRATLGGMVGNNAAGARSLRYGCMADHLLAVDCVLAGGDLITLSAVDEAVWKEKMLIGGVEGKIYQTMQEIAQKNREAIAAHFPKIPRRVSGYNLDRLLTPFPLNPAQLIAGAEGSLGITTLIKVAVVPKLLLCGLCLISCATMLEALRAAETLLSFSPLSLEMIDREILSAALRSPAIKKPIEWLAGDPAALLVAEFDGSTKDEVEEKLRLFSRAVTEEKIGYRHSCLIEPEKMQQLWQMRKAGLGLLLSRRSFSRAIAFLEDISVAPSQLAPFMEKFFSYLSGKGMRAGIYGHVGAGCLHIRPYIDLRDPEQLAQMRQMMLDVSDMLLDHQGALSGEHGDGLVRSWLNEKMFGEEVYGAFMALKRAFDPKNRMNPGKIVGGVPLESNLRLHPSSQLTAPPTFLDFSKEGGFALAVDMCNGNGECRKKEGTMCPSFQATGNEYDTTRARAQALRAAIHGKLAWDSHTDHAINDILDLCIECKGCKSECPSQVDMAKIKAEFLHSYQKKYGVSLRSRLFGNIDKVNSWLMPMGRWMNKRAASSATKALLSWLGITPHRALPSFAKERFSSWAKRNVLSKHDPQVILLIDTFTEFNHPQVGQAAVAVLQRLGYGVLFPPWRCCGRPLISKGLLKQAQGRAHTLIATLKPYAEQGLPIIGLEPSCLLTIKDDIPDLVSPQWKGCAKRVAGQCITFAEFLAAKAMDLLLSHERAPCHLLVHGHCHQKSLVGMAPTMQLLRATGSAAELIAAGCCGMAGSFGYEKEHYELSMRIGELQLFPAIRAAPAHTITIADGTSCRSHIFHATGVQPLHLAEFLAQVRG